MRKERKKERRNNSKEMYLTIHVTHFTYDNNIMLSDIIKNQSNCERGNLLPPLHGPFF